MVTSPYQRLFRVGAGAKLRLEEKLKDVYLMGTEVRKNMSSAGQEVSKSNEIVHQYHIINQT